MLHQALGCGPAEHERAVQRLQAERKETSRALRAATDELAALLADQLLSAAHPSEHWAEHRIPSPALCCVARHWWKIG